MLNKKAGRPRKNVNNSNVTFTVNSTTSSAVIITDTSKNYFDNQWHHFALVVNRMTNTVCYI